MSRFQLSYIVDEEEGSPVGVCIDLSNGDQVWSGEVANATFEAQPLDVRDQMGSAAGDFVVYGQRGDTPRIMARAANAEDASALAIAFGEWLERVAQ